MTKVHFKGESKDEFLLEIRKKVEEYFLNHSKNGNTLLHLKGIFLAATCIFLWTILMLGLFPSIPRLFFWILIGLNQILLSMNVGHDAVHGAYSKSPKVNQFLSYIAYDLLGLSSWVWKFTHNQGHHTYTNIAGHDPDISKPGLLRLSPHTPKNWAHPYQHCYIWLLYGLVGMNWILYGDYAFIYKEREKITRNELIIFFMFKALNLALFFFLPLIYSPMTLSQIIIGYFAMQFAGGFTAALIFQLAHIVENVDFPLPDDEGIIGKPWGSHEMETTANFATHSLFITHAFGGLNYQIEHHLFPKISHVHYPRISVMLRATAQKYGLPYHEQPTFLSAIASHFRTIRNFGTTT